MGLGKDVMDQAHDQVARASKTMGHRIGTKLWYTGRKQLRSSPRTFLPKLGSLAGHTVEKVIIDLAIEKLINKVMTSKHAKKLEKSLAAVAENPSNLDALRKLAKEEAKLLKATALKIDENQVKLKDSRTEQTNAVNKYIEAMEKPVPSGELLRQASLASVDMALFELAFALCEAERYEDKILLLVEIAQGQLDDVREYIEKSRDVTLDIQKQLIDHLDEYGTTPGEDERVDLLHPGPHIGPRSVDPRASMTATPIPPAAWGPYGGPPKAGPAAAPPKIR